jgi:hypothetical protein
MNIKKNELINVWQVLNKLSGISGNAKWAYTIAKNKLLLKDEVKAIEEALAPDEEYKQYEQKRLSLCQELADKDSNDKPIIENNIYVMTKNKELFEEKMLKLNNDNLEIIKRRMDFVSQIDEILKEEIDIPFYVIELKDIPDGINAVEMESILLFIEE